MTGETLLHYRIGEKLGQGGMGEVYKAEDLHLDRFVAVKILREDVASEAHRRRFLKEAKAASALNHPNILHIYDAGAHQGRDFIVMELVTGQPLSRAIPRTGVSVDAALRYTQQIAEALAAAHAAGIVHRDLKPANLMVNASGHVKVLDFGIAKLHTFLEPGVGPEGEDTRTVTSTELGLVMGTAAYMSPEQALGEPVDGRSDVFSLGVVFYEMLAGRRPFAGANTAALIHSLHYDDPRPLSELRPDVPEEVEDLLRRMLRKDREQRCQSMKEVAEEARRLIRLTESREVGAATRPMRPPAIRRRNRRLAWAGAVAAAAILTGWGLWRFAVPAARRTVESRTAYQHVEAGREALRRYDRQGAIDRAIEEFQRAVAAQPGNAAAHAGLAMAYYRKGANRDRQFIEQAVGNGRRAVELNPDLAGARAAFGLGLLEAGRRDEAMAEFQKAILIEPGNADALRGMGLAHARAGRAAEAEAAYRKAIEARRDWEMEGSLGAFYFESGRYPEAETHFKESVRLAPDSHISRRNLAAVYQIQNRLEDAAAELQKSLEIQPTSATYSVLLNIHYYRGMYTEAAAAGERGLQLDPHNYLAWANVADCYRWIPGAEEKARRAYARAIEIGRERLAQRPKDVTLRGRLAVYLAKSGRKAEGLEGARKLEAEGVRTAPALFRNALVYEIAGDRAKALAAVKAALAAGYSRQEIQKDPEFAELRKDVRYHEILIDNPTKD